MTCVHLALNRIHSMTLIYSKGGIIHHLGENARVFVHCDSEFNQCICDFLHIVYNVPISTIR